MPLPLATAGLSVARIAALGLAAYALYRQTAPATVRQPAEDMLDRLPEGLAAGPAPGRPGQFNAEGRWRRKIRLGRNGPGIEIDLSALGRLRLRRI